MRSSILATLSLALLCAPCPAEDLTKEQMEPWKALHEQVSLGMDRKWDEMEKFLIPSLCIWGDKLPSPVSLSPQAYEYSTKLEEAGDEVVGHHLVPVTVRVVGDVAIINAYHRVATMDEDGKSEETINRLHNTWMKHDGQWKLLATYNTIVSPASDDDCL